MSIGPVVGSICVNTQQGLQAGCNVQKHRKKTKKKKKQTAQRSFTTCIVM